MTNSNSYLIPLAIIIAGVIIAGAVLYTKQQPSLESNSQNSKDSQQTSSLDLARKALPITSEDHIFGNKDASLAIIEFSDLQCPFCARFHLTMKQVLEEFGPKVKWVYRHFPLTSIHPEAFGSALASECVAYLGGNEAFWHFVDKVFENQKTMNENLYRKIALDLGLDITEYDKCFSQRTFENKVKKDLEQALASGGQGTPYNIIVDEKGNVFPFSGALPFEQVKSLLEQVMKNN